MKLASIVIPTKNRANLLVRAIRAALDQTIPCEVVVFDGASTDATKDICEAYGNQIQYYRLDRDPGFIQSWYAGCALASGEYIHINPDDDWIEPSFMEKTTGMFRDNVGMVMTQALVHFDGKEPQQNLSKLQTGYFNSAEIEMQFIEMPMTISPACWTARKSDILDNLHSGRFPYAKYRHAANEVYMTMSMLRDYPAVGIIEEPLAHFGGQDDASTMVAVKAGGETLERFYAEYRMVKESYMKLKEGY
jgi:hypothetical protein